MVVLRIIVLIITTRQVKKMVELSVLIMGVITTRHERHVKSSCPPSSSSPWNMAPQWLICIPFMSQAACKTNDSIWKQLLGICSLKHIPKRLFFLKTETALAWRHSLEYGFSVADLHSVYVPSIVEKQWLYLVTPP